jgi:hypothetical protein
MNGENNHIFHTSALDGMTPGLGGRRSGWTLFAIQLWLLVAFVAMSLIAVAARSLISGEQSAAVSASLAVVGIALFPLAWRNVAQVLDRADGESRSGERPSTPNVDAHRAAQLKLALHR